MLNFMHTANPIYITLCLCVDNTDSELDARYLYFISVEYLCTLKSLQVLYIYRPSEMESNAFILKSYTEEY